LATAFEIVGTAGGIVSAAVQAGVLQAWEAAGFVTEQKLSATAVPPFLQLTARVCVPPPQVFEQELQAPVLQA
jgi:hypothetical protein